MVGLRGQWTMKRNDIRIPVKALKIRKFDPQGIHFRGSLYVISQHVTTETYKDFCGNQANFTQSDKPDCLAVQVKAHQTVQGKVPLPYPIVGPMGFSIECKNKGKGMLGH